MQSSQRQIRKRFPLIISIMFVAALAAMPGASILAQSQTIKAESLIKGTLDVKPGELRTISFKVTSAAGAEVKLDASVDAPPGWQSVISPESFELGAGESRTVFVTLGVREYETAGTYDVTFKLLTGGAVAARAGMRVQVEAVSALKLTALPSNPVEVAAREDYTLGFSLINGGNAPVEVSLSAESGLNWRLSVMPASITLDPGGTAGVQVSVQVPRKLPEVASHRVTLTASGETAVGMSSAAGAAVFGAIEAKERVTAYATTRVIPVTLAKTMYATLDGALRLLGEWRESGDGALQASVELGGDLGGGRRAEFLASAPVAGGNSRGTLATFGSEERLTASYSDEAWGKIEIGDISAGTVSPLLRQNLNGRGVHANVHFGWLDARAFYNKSPLPLPTETMGIQLEKEFGENSSVKISFLQSDDASAAEDYARPHESMTAYSAFILAAPSESFSIEAEAAASNDGPEGSDGAYRIYGKYSNSGALIGLELIHAGSNFIGAWRDVDIKRGNFTYQVAKDFSLWGNMTNSSRNVDGNPDLSAAKEDSFAIGASLGLGDFGKLRVTFREDDRRDTNLNAFDIESQTGEYEISKSWGGTRLAILYRDRERTDNLTGEIEDSESIRIYGGTKIANRTSLNFSVTQTRENAGSNSLNTLQTTLGAAAKLSKNMDLAFDFQRNEHPNIGATSWTNAALTARLEGGSSVHLRVRHASGAFEIETTVGLELVYPLGIPVKSVAKGGRIVGRIYFEHSPEIGVINAVVSVAGMQVITGESGTFAFPLVPEGVHELSVAMTQGGVGLVPRLQMPLAVTVKVGETFEANIPVVESGSIEGTVKVEKKRPGSPAEYIPAADVILELESGSFEQNETISLDEVGKTRRKQYRLTDTRGRFLFSGLAPGHYIVRVWQEGLPKFSEAIPNKISLTINPGDVVQNTDFAIKAVQREIEITVG